MSEITTVDEFAQWLEDNDHCNSQGLSLTYPDEVYTSYVEIHGLYADGPDEYISDADDAYHGEFDSDEEFAESLAEDIGAIDRNAAWPNNHIDWTAAASDLMMDYTEQNRYYFRSN